MPSEASEAKQEARKSRCYIFTGFIRPLLHIEEHPMVTLSPGLLPPSQDSRPLSAIPDSGEARRSTRSPSSSRAVSAAPGREPAELDRLGDRIAELAAHINAATYQLLVMLREFDEREGWYGGFKSCAHWLSWRTSLSPGAARERVRVARTLEDLPLLSEAMRKGELSCSKARALTRVATPANEADLVEFARHATAAHVEKVVAGMRKVDRIEEERLERARHAKRELWLIPEPDGSYVIRGRLDPEVGAVLAKALEAADEKLHPEWKTRREVPAPQRRADALGLVAEGALGTGIGEGSRADRFQVVVHVQAATDAAGPGLAVAASSLALEHSPATDAEQPRITSNIEHGPRVSAETSRRLSCDASRVVMTHAPDGGVLDVGRRTRTVPPALRRALQHRDGGCRFPGCTNRFCDAHHMKHWKDGGETKLANLILLCRFHHRAIHEEGFGVEIEALSEVRFTDPAGRPLPEVPLPPPIANDPAAALKGAHEEDGIDIDPWTGTPIWHGEPLDLGYTVMVLRQPPREPGPAAADVSAETRSIDTSPQRRRPGAFGSRGEPGDWGTARYSESFWHH
jgi:hypothetical protein